MRIKRIANKTFLSLAATVLSLILLEIGVRGYEMARSYFIHAGAPQSTTAPLHVVNDSPMLYRLNPAHPDINSQGVRDDEVAIPKPAGVGRILVLGDSVAYGNSVPRADAFPNRLERMSRQFGPVEVINAAVMGYTPYNELQYYLHAGRKFDAEVVIVAFCMNDVANPRLHWSDAPGLKFPPEAIPNPVYDRDHILPRVRKLEEEDVRRKRSAEESPSLLRYSRLYNLLEPAVGNLFRPRSKDPEDTKKKTPTYITGEDRLSIEVLIDRSSSEWRWLASIYDRLHEAVQADRAKLVIVVFPLAYQLDAGYPFFPQEQIKDYCSQNSIPCLDLLPAFKLHRKEDIFVLDKEVYHDIWHLTDYGHEVSANEIQRFLIEKELLPVHK